MPDQFDPYHRWLGVPPDEQPPHHYRLLGIQQFEADADVIEAAADRQMAHLRTYQTGRHIEASQRLLNEVAAARLCLLSPPSKAKYDGQLRASRKVVPAAEPLPVAQPIAATQEPAGPGLGVPSIHTSSASQSYRRKKGAWQVPAALGAGVLLAAGLLFAFSANTLINFFTMHGYFFRRFDTYPYLVALDTQHRNIDIIAYDNGLSDSPGQNQHD